MDNEKKDLENMIVAMNNLIIEKGKLEEENKRLTEELVQIVKLYDILKENIDKIKDIFLNM